MTVHAAQPVIVWFRQDLRLGDNAALDAALRSGQPVVPVYVLDDDSPGAWALGGAARWWLHHSLASLHANLKERGAGLILRRGRADRVIAELVRQTAATAVHAGRMHEPWARTADAAVQDALGPVPLHLHRTATLFDLDDIKTKTGGIYGVYTPFAKACRARGDLHAAIPAPAAVPAAPAVASDDLDTWRLLPTRPDWAGGFRDTWQVGEAAAQTRLAAFLKAAVQGYDIGRNLPGQAGTSMLSAHLHWGELSPRQVWHLVLPLSGDGVGVYLGELLWREFAAYLLWHNPHMPEQPLRPAFGRLPFRTAPAELRAWQRGRTGVPIVDAGMRQLWHIGWMHNRVRMIAASFLVKHLLIDWREGERWFWDTLVDADLAANAASWQWIAGSGIDSQPFFRIFNPVSQGERWDKAGEYVRRWVPELAGLPDAVVQAPWTSPSLHRDYPAPIVELGAGRDRALGAYRATVRQAEA